MFAHFTVLEDKNKNSCLVQCCLLIVIGGQKIMTAPVNMAAKVSSQTVLNCTANPDDGDYVTWDYLQKESQIPVRIYTSDEADVMLDQRDKFDIDRDDTNGIHNLVIKNVQMDLGAPYFCGFALEGMKEAAELVALSMLRTFTARFRLEHRRPRQLASYPQ